MVRQFSSVFADSHDEEFQINSIAGPSHVFSRNLPPSGPILPKVAGRLPSELVSRIFSAALEDDDERIKIRPLALPLVLSGVCGQWRDIVLSMPICGRKSKSRVEERNWSCSDVGSPVPERGLFL
jgi:hypothetical protein